MINAHSALFEEESVHIDGGSPRPQPYPDSESTEESEFDLSLNRNIGKVDHDMQSVRYVQSASFKGIWDINLDQWKFSTEYPVLGPKFLFLETITNL